MGVFIIAEAGVNHNGDINLAKKLVDIAYESGADAIKFQTFKAEESTGQFAEMAEYQKENMSSSISQFEMIRKLELPFEAFKEIKEYCKEKGIIFISTPDGIESLGYLNEIGVPIIKIGSTEITNHKFLGEIGKSACEIILSTGMSNLEEVGKAIESLGLVDKSRLTVLHCTTNYPTKFTEVNLKAMITMKEAFNVKVGYSDHTLGNEAAIAAVALGAKIIEKHFTISRDLEGPDHKASLEPHELKKFVQAIRNTEKLMGDGIKRATESEKRIMASVRRSIVANENLNKGKIISESDLDYKRPGNGMKPEEAYKLIGKKLINDIKKDQLLSINDVE